MKNSHKMTTLITSSVIGMMAASMALTSYAGSAKFGHNDDNIASMVDKTAVNIEQAMTIAQRDTPGQVIEAELEREDGTMVWEIELLGQDQQVYEFEIAATDGRILEKEIENH